MRVSINGPTVTVVHKDIISFSYSNSNDTHGTSRIIFDISNKWNQCTCIERSMDTWLCTVTLSNVSAQLGRCAGAQCARKSVVTSPELCSCAQHACTVRMEKCRHLSRAGGHFLPWAWSSLGLAFKPGSHGWSYTSARSHFTFPQVLHFTFGTYIMIVQKNKFYFWKLCGYKLIMGFAIKGLASHC